MEYDLPDTAIFYADSARGIYIPQFFAESIKRKAVAGVSDEEWAILESGPDHEWYWDTWSDVEQNAIVTDPESGTVYRLIQDGDLWLVPDDWDPEQDAAILNRANEIVRDRLEYEERHPDAGDAYAQLPAEGSWDYDDNDSKLTEWCKARGIDTGPLGPDEIGRIGLDVFEMRAGSIYGPYNTGDSDFVACAFPLQEIEIPLWDDMKDETAWDDFVRVLVGTNDCDAYVTGTGLAYATTDAVWFAIVPEADLRDAIAAELERRA